MEQEGTSQESHFPDAVGIKALDAEGIGSLVATMGLPPYRAKQIVAWVYGRGVSSYEEMTDVPAAMRDELARRLALPSPTVLERHASSDGTRKYLVRFGDGVTVECVGLPANDRLTVCFSTQAGCAMGCTFCATGASGFERNLGPGEMVDQIRIVGGDFEQRVTNAVAMGQGEPFANYAAVMGALRLINSPNGLGIGARHITVSTCGLLRGIERFAHEPEQFTLAVSLHSAVQATRDALMPGLRNAPLPALRAALIQYSAISGRRPSVEYAIIAGVNDSDEELDALATWCRGMLVHVNLIPLNPVDDSVYRRADAARVTAFAHRLEASGVDVSVRVERGSDIAAACGQLQRRERS